MVICGKRGTGKDTLMSYLAYKKPHNSNVILQPNTNLIELNELFIPNLDRRELVNNSFEPISRDKYNKFDNPTFISDASIYFPSYDDSNLKKDYPSLPINYAIWRHLYKAGLHFNTQNIDRLYKILREQVSDCLMTKWCIYTPLYVVMSVRYYESAKDCIDKLKPIKINLMKKDVNLEIEKSRRSEIKDYLLIIPRRMIRHDSYYFHRVIFGKERQK